MSRQRTNIFVNTISLLTGCILYILFRENTYVAKFLPRIPLIESLRAWISPVSSNFIKFYLPDFAWCLSLSCGLEAIFTPSQMGNLLCGGTAFICGTLWECMQYSNIVSGTGDILDIVSYFLASTLCIILNLKERKNENT